MGTDLRSGIGGVKMSSEELKLISEIANTLTTTGILIVMMFQLWRDHREVRLQSHDDLRERVRYLEALVSALLPIRQDPKEDPPQTS